MARWGKRLGPWLLALATAGLLVLCYPPWNLGGLVWVALTPLLVAIWWRPEQSTTPAPGNWWRRVWRRKHGFGLGYLGGWLFFTLTFWWIGTLGTLFKAPALHGIPVLLSAYLALYPGLWALGTRWMAPAEYRFDSSWRNLALAVGTASLWVVLEWIRGWLFSGFGWQTLAVAVRQQLAIIQIADLTGSYGLSWLIMFVNAMLVILVRRVVAEFGPQLLRRVRWEFSAAMAVVAAVFVYGVAVQPRVDRPPTMALTFSVAALQPNVPEELKFAKGAREDEVFAILRELNARAVKTQPSLIIWPEAATPRGYFADEANFNFLKEVARMGRFNLLTGSLDYDLDPEHADTTNTFNTAMLFSEQGEHWQVYRKMHLVPFGEYMPFRTIMPDAINELVPGDLASGVSPTLLRLPFPPLQIGALVCFEDSLGNLTREFSKLGASLLVNITNDAWFLKTVGAEMHLANAQLRAVENRRPLLRCTNTGITCLVDPFGRLERWLPPFTRDLVTKELTVWSDRPVTFYARHGDWFPIVGGLVAVAALVRAGLRRRARSGQ